MESERKIRYVCECGVEIEGKTWDWNEIPLLWCPSCGKEMGAERGPGL